MKNLILYFILFLTLAGCGNEQPAQEKVILPEPLPNPALMVKARFECQEIAGTEESEPKAIVYLHYNEQQHAIDTVSTCSVLAPEMYRNYDIPKEALSACGGWWAGYGTFFYVLNQGDSSLVVMEAQRAQKQDTIAFRYEPKTRIPLQ
ncbi:hypothetical protein [Pontibacter vulgaris]|uniref:hypothetical protein n=1 Tax=Pontibacter vulgaris TaxID=2905679 RepID=UPI001FA70C07|nr:hypothetical protein [Pontibacter vulgaris]